MASDFSSFPPLQKNTCTCVSAACLLNFEDPFIGRELAALYPASPHGRTRLVRHFQDSMTAWPDGAYLPNKVGIHSPKNLQRYHYVTYNEQWYQQVLLRKTTKHIIPFSNIPKTIVSSFFLDSTSSAFSIFFYRQQIALQKKPGSCSPPRPLVEL